MISELIMGAYERFFNLFLTGTAASQFGILTL